MKNKKFVRICSLLMAAMILASCGDDGAGAPETTAAEELETIDELASSLLDVSGIVLTDEQLYERTAGSWVGQMIGVAWAAATEFRYQGVIMPESAMPEWSAGMVNDAFGQDDLFVEVPFIDAMKDKGIDCSIDTMGEYFANSTFWLAHANHIGRENIRAGIPAAEAGHYKNNWHADDIDWQIEADFLGNIYPGNPTKAAERAFEIGHLMNYGDGVYGGVFVSAMHAAAFTAKSLREIIDIGIKSIPEGTKFRMMMDETVAGYDAGMTWEALWAQLEANWGTSDKCPEFSGAANIDAKMNAAYILIGLLYGEGDFEKTILISTQCGQDSDCNPSSAAAILGTFYGLSYIPDKYKSAVDYTGAKFAYTDYTLEDCIKINCDLAREYMDESCDKTDLGWVLPPELSIEPVPFEQWPDDAVTAYLTVTPKSDGVVGISYLHVAPTDVTMTLDLGDGTVLDGGCASYQYLESGTYTVTLTVTDENGVSATDSETVEVSAKRPYNVKASSSNMNPQGGGSRDINVICDGIIPNGSDLKTQYDTFGAFEEAWFALEFDRRVTVSKIFFTEGAHFGDGGWFEVAPKAELLIDGVWVETEAVISPLYIEVDALESQGAPYETFTYELAIPTACDGVRIIGEPGGSNDFASCAELDVAYTEVENPITGLTGDIVRDSLIMVSETSPSGAGNKNIELMRDGYIPKSGEHHGDVQYDTFTGESNDHDDYFGYTFRYDCEITSVTFTEGSHFGNGGWFKDGSIRIEALIDGAWTAVETECSPKYPNGDAQGKFGNPFQTYTFTLKSPTVCRGIRVIGLAGGEAHFASVAELSVEGAAK